MSGLFKIVVAVVLVGLIFINTSSGQPIDAGNCKNISVSTGVNRINSESYTGSIGFGLGRNISNTLDQEFKFDIGHRNNMQYSYVGTNSFGNLIYNYRNDIFTSIQVYHQLKRSMINLDKSFVYGFYFGQGLYYYNKFTVVGLSKDKIDTYQSHYLYKTNLTLSLSIGASAYIKLNGLSRVGFDIGYRRNLDRTEQFESRITYFHAIKFKNN